MTRAPQAEGGFNIAAWALRRRALVLLVIGALVIAGVVSASGLASGIYPEVDFPRIGVVVRQGDAPPAVFQTNVVRPLEQALTTVLGVRRVRSRTIRGGAEISLLFAPDSDMWRALQLVQTSVADVRPTLPADAVIHVERLTPVSFPVLTFNLSGPVDPRVLNEIARFRIAPVIARVPGVGNVSVLGGEVRELEVIVDPARAAAAHLRLEDIAASVRRAIPLAAVGRFDQDRALITVMASADASGAEDIARVPLGVDANGLVRTLGQVATVVEGAEDRYFRTTGPRGESAIIAVARAEGESTPDVVAAVLQAARGLERSFPRGVRLEPVYDQGSLVRASMTSVRDAILLGIALCLLVIGVFLRDARAGFVASVAVPTTLAMTFVAMALAGQTLNLMSLGGMAVAIGLVVDDAIVIVEAIARRLELGDDPETAAREGTRDLTAAVVGTTVTTVIVFIPLVFLPGIVGSFFGALAITLSSAVVISLFVALFLVPIVAARVMRPLARGHGASPLEARVGRMVAWCSGRAWLGVAACVGAAAFTSLALDHIRTGFMPGCDEGAFVIDYETPAGTALSETDAIARRIEAILARTPEVATFSRRTGAELGPAMVTLLNTGDISVRLRSGPRRHAEAVMDDVRSQIEHEVPGVQLDFIQMLQDMLGDLAGAPHPIEIKIFGEDYAVLERLTHEASARVERIAGLVDFTDGIEHASAERNIDIDRERAARVGVAADDVAREVSNGMLGTAAGAIRRFDRTIGVRVRYPDSVRLDPEALPSLPIAYALDGTPVPLSAVATLTNTVSPTVLYHEGLEPVVIMHADHAGRDLGSVVRDIERAMAHVHFPPGYRYELGGQHAEQVATSARLARVALFGMLLVLLVLVAQFQKIGSALAVLLTAPLSLVGALLALWLTDTPLDASSSMGCVLLVGLVVKNGILLLEVAEEHVAEGIEMSRALAMAAERRIRPIAMTTLATLFGLMPLALAIGAGSELQRPLAIAVIGGLSVSTLASLAVLPSLAVMFERIAVRTRGAFGSPTSPAPTTAAE